MELTLESFLDTISEYEHRYNTCKLGYDEAIKLSKEFLKKTNPSKIIAFREEYFDEPKIKQKPQILEGTKQIERYFRDEVSYGEDNYFIVPENLEWVLMLCHESDLHIYGSKEIVEKFKEVTKQ